jgi:peptidoglycan/LPS O-acetylase OafA/YrhL
MSDLAIGGFCAYYSFVSTSFRHTIQNLPSSIIVFIYVLGFYFALYGNYIFSNDFNIIFLRLFNTFFYGFIILEQNFAKNSFIKLGYFKYLSNLGKYNYGLYLLYPIGIQIVIILFKTLKISSNGFPIGISQTFIYAGIAFCFSLLMSIVSYHYFEMHFLKLKDKFTTLK